MTAPSGGTGSGDGGTGGTGPGTGTDPGTDPGGGDPTDWQSQAETLQRELDRWKGVARQHEERAKRNADQAKQAQDAITANQTLEQRLASMEKAMAERDVADLENRGQLALADVRTALADAQIPREDVSAFLALVDPVTTLLKDGVPNEEAIKSLVDSLKRIAGKITPDPDQGRKGGQPPRSMNDMIRRKAGIIAR